MEVFNLEGVAGLSGNAGTICDDVVRFMLALLEGREPEPPSRSRTAVGLLIIPGGTVGVERLGSATASSGRPGGNGGVERRDSSKLMLC